MSLYKLKESLGLGARSNKYRLILNLPVSVKGEDAEVINTLVKSAALPGRSFTDVDIMVQGKKITVAGEVEYSGDLTLTFMDTEDHKIRRTFNNWMNEISNINKGVRNVNSVNDYMTTVQLQQLSTSDGSIKVIYEYYNLYPKNMGDISYSDATNNEIIEFTMDFGFSSWEIV